MFGQEIFFLSSRWDHELSDWIILDSTESEIGNITYAGIFKDPFQTWNLRLGEYSGNIKLRWKDSPNEWDLWAGNELVSFKPVWQQSFDQWNFNFNGKNYNLKLSNVHSNLSWELSNNSGKMYAKIQTDFEFDIRDWTIYYFDDIPDRSLILSCLFVVLRYSQTFLH